MIDLSSKLSYLNLPHDAPILVHSSFRQIAREGFTPEQVIETLLGYASSGTVLMPTMSWRYVKPEQPEFDELNTPSNTGVLTEVFRTKYATRRSLHPTHSVAGCGFGVDQLLNEHHLDNTPCSVRSPFGKLVEADGWVLMLGIGFDCCTLIHHCEELVAPEIYLRLPALTESYTCTGRHGEHYSVKLQRHLLLRRDYWQFQDQMALAGLLKLSYLGSVTCRAFRAQDLFDVTMKTLQHQADAILAKPGQRYRRM